MKLKPWAMMPTAWIQDGKLHNFVWKDDGSAGTTALMIYFVLCQLAAHRPLRPSENPEPEPGKPSAPDQPETSGPAAVPASVASALMPPLPPTSAPIGVDFGARQPAPWTRETLIAGGVKPSAASEIDWDQVLEPETLAALKVQVTPNPAITHVAGWGSTAMLSLPEKSQDVIDGETPDSLVARVTYEELIELLGGMSKDRISAGLQKLIREKMIWRVDRSSSYGLTGFGPGKRWAKLPGKILLSAGETHFHPFPHFKLRSKHELNALKLLFYYAHTRDSKLPYSTVSYPMIVKKSGVAERDIPRANSFLISCGMLQRTRGFSKDDLLDHESNKYHLTGYDSLIKTKAAP